MESVLHVWFGFMPKNDDGYEEGFYIFGTVDDRRETEGLHYATLEQVLEIEPSFLNASRFIYDRFTYIMLNAVIIWEQGKIISIKHNASIDSF